MRSRRNEALVPQTEPFASSEVEKRASDDVGERVSTSLDMNGVEGSSSKHVPERTCVLTRTPGTRERLIRLALAPDGSVHPDVRARAPGRGAWIGVGRHALEQARVKGKLKGALSRAFKTGEVAIGEDLAPRTEAALAQAALDRLGMEARAGTLVIGSERIDSAARAGKVHLLLHAADAGTDGNGKLDQAWRVGGGEQAGLVLPVDRTRLSMALGRENVVHIAVGESGAAGRVRLAVERWLGFIGTPGLQAPDGTIPSGEKDLDGQA